jgi:hypothetical protein
MPHSIINGDACFAYFNKIWGIPKLGTPSCLPIIAFDYRICRFQTSANRVRLACRKKKDTDLYHSRSG